MASVGQVGDERGRRRTETHDEEHHKADETLRSQRCASIGTQNTEV